MNTDTHHIAPELVRQAAEDTADRKKQPFVWDTPIPFDDVSTPDIPASLLPGIYGTFSAALASAGEIPEALAVSSVLGTLSAVCNKRFVVSPYLGWMEPINLYILVGLPPANNKSLVVRNCVQPIDLWEASQRQAIEGVIKEARSRRKNEEAQIQSLRAGAAKSKDATAQRDTFAQVNQLEAQLTEVPAAPQVYLNDVTPETLTTAVCEQNGRIAIISDEGGIMETMAGLYSKGQANYDILLKGIDGGRVRLMRKDRTLDANPLISIMLIVQPQVIRNMAGQKAFHGRGLLERFLYVLPRSSLGYRTLVATPVPPSVSDEFTRGITQLLNIQPLIEHGFELPRVLTLSDEALAQWQGFRHEVEVALRPDAKLHVCLGWGGKIVGFTLRIAGLLHVAGHGHSILSIDSSTMKRAITMAHLLIEHALTAFGRMREDEAMEDAKAVFNWIEQTQNSTFRRTECLRKFHGRFTSKKRLDAAITVLIDRSIISPARTEITTPGKRGTVLHDVNPQLFTAGQ
jgi:hypothetical protein